MRTQDARQTAQDQKMDLVEMGPISALSIDSQL